MKICSVRVSRANTALRTALYGVPVFCRCPRCGTLLDIDHFQRLSRYLKSCIRVRLEFKIDKIWPSTPTGCGC